MCSMCFDKNAKAGDILWAAWLSCRLSCWYTWGFLLYATLSSTCLAELVAYLGVALLSEAELVAHLGEALLSGAELLTLRATWLSRVGDRAGVTLWAARFVCVGGLAVVTLGVFFFCHTQFKLVWLSWWHTWVQPSYFDLTGVTL